MLSIICIDFDYSNSYFVTKFKDEISLKTNVISCVAFIIDFIIVSE